MSNVANPRKRTAEAADLSSRELSIHGQQTNTRLRRNKPKVLATDNAPVMVQEGDLETAIVTDSTANTKQSQENSCKHQGGFETCTTHIHDGFIAPTRKRDARAADLPEEASVGPSGRPRRAVKPSMRKKQNQGTDTETQALPRNKSTSTKGKGRKRK